MLPCQSQQVRCRPTAALGAYLRVMAIRQWARPATAVRLIAAVVRSRGRHLRRDLVHIAHPARESPEIRFEIDHVVRGADLLEEETVVVQVSGEQVDPVDRLHLVLPRRSGGEEVGEFEPCPHDCLRMRMTLIGGLRSAGFHGGDDPPARTVTHPHQFVPFGQADAVYRSLDGAGGLTRYWYRTSNGAAAERFISHRSADQHRAPAHESDGAAFALPDGADETAAVAGAALAGVLAPADGVGEAAVVADVPPLASPEPRLVRRRHSRHGMDRRNRQPPQAGSPTRHRPTRNATCGADMERA